MNRHLSWLFLLAIAFPAFAQSPAPLAVGNQFVVRTANERSTLDRLTGEIVSTVDVTLFNLGGREILAPLHAVISLSTGGVTVTGADSGPNDPPYNAYYKDLTPTMTGGRLAANEERSFSLTFRHARTINFTYEVVPLAGSLRTENVPQLNVPPGPFSVDEGQLLLIPFTATDPDGDFVTLGAAPAISNALFDAAGGLVATGRLEFIPDFDQAGFYTLQVKAVDRLGQTVTTNLLIEVRNVNRPPVMNAVEARTVAEGDLLEIDLPVSDPDGDLLVITPDVLPPNSLLITGTPKLVFAPDFDQAGNYAVVLTVSDGNLSAAPQLVEITVEDVAVSDPGETNQFTLSVDPISSPSLATRQRVTGNVNGSTNAPAREPATAALITGLSPAVVRQGETLDVVVSGASAGIFATHFDESSQPLFGPDISVNLVTISNATLMVANISVDADATPGIRDVSVITSNETAYSVVAMTVDAGLTSLTGKLVNANTTNAIAGAIVTVEGTSFWTTTGLDGSFVLNGLPPGTYTLIVNPPDHELMQFQFTVQNGVPTELGSIATPPTVFDPNAPASVSLLSVLGRGLGSFDVTSMSQTKQAITDTLLLTGGTEAGVVDEYGNQLNSLISGDGLVSILPAGVRKMAEHQDRGESVALQEVLFAISSGWVWTNGPSPLLSEWLETLQGLINNAWAEPTNPSNALPIVIFNQGRTLTPLPPQITPATRLNPVQHYLFVISMLSYASIGTNAEFARVSDRWLDHDKVASTSWRDLWSLVIPSAIADDPPPPAPQRLWTSYWRGFSGAKNNFLQSTLSDAASNLASLSAVMAGVAASADLRVGLLAMPMVGHLGTEITAALGAVAIGSRVPEAPILIGYEIVEGPQLQTNAPGVPRVKIKFRRTPNDLRNGQFLYTLYRFRNFDEGRQLVNFNSFHQPTTSNLNELVLTDLEPFPGSVFYAVTCSRLYTIGDTVSDNELNNVLPFWNAPVRGLNPVGAFIAAKQMMVSDYSDPIIVYVGSPESSIPISDIELDPITGAAYYSDKSGAAENRKIYKIDLFGDGSYRTNAFTSFADPGQEGMARDAGGAIYMLNKSSQAKFGGRLFRFDGESGVRSHVGQVNYYSRDLMFANPTDAYALDMGPAEFLPPPNQDLFMVDMIAGQVKRAPVMATFDPFRRVAQPYADYPYASRPADMEHDASGNTFILVPEAIPRKPFNDREKGPMHRPPGAPIKIDCPPKENNPFVDPVYLHSGEFYEDEQDIQLRGVGLDFVWVRKYRSKIGTNTVQGNSWDYSYNIYIEQNTNTGGVVVHDGHTRADEYVASGVTNRWTLAEFFRELIKNPDQTYTLEFEDKGVWNFYGFTGSPGDGRIKESIDRHGNRLQFFYDGQGRLDRVNDTLGRDIFVSYNAAGYISDITDFAGRNWHYEYYGAAEAGGNVGDLKSVRTPLVTGTPNGNDFPSGKTTTYTYSKGFSDPRLNGNLLTVTDAKGQTYLSNTYSTNTNPDDLTYDRIIQQRWGNAADTIEFCYIAVNPTPANGNSIIRVILNNRIGHVQEYFYNAFNQCTIEREFTGKANNSQFTTGTQNRPVNKLRPTDPDYFETRYEWNSDSLKKRQVHPNGNVTEWIYEGELTTNVTARTRGNIRIVRHLPGTHSITGDQQVIEERYEYDTSYGRGCCGFNFVTKHWDGRSNVTVKSYSPLGDLTQVVQRAATMVENYDYDSRGRTVRIVAPENGSGHRRVDRFEFYGLSDGHQNGFLKRTIQDDGGFNITTTYEYDNRGNPIRIIDPRGFDTVNVFNQMDEVIRAYSAEVSPGVRYYVDSFFDANGNLIRTDTLNMDEFGVVIASNPVFTTTSEYDILNVKLRQIEEIEPGRTVTVEYQHDGNRNLVLTRYGAAVSGLHPRNVSRSIHDERDRPYRLIDAEGDPSQISAQFDYDHNGNIVRHVVGLEHPRPQVTTRAFDQFDRKVSETDSMGNVTRLHYDANHNMTQMVRYAEVVDVPGSTNNVRHRESRFELDAMNRQVRTVTLLFDPITQVPLGDGEAVSQIFYNDIGLVTRVIDDLGHEARSVYDRLGRLSQSFDHLSNSVQRIYDANGNEVTSISIERPFAGGASDVFTVTNTYDNLSRLVRSVDNEGNTNRVFYNSRHAVVRTIDPRGNVIRNVFDGLMRKVQTIHELTTDGTGAGGANGQIVLSQTFDDSSRLTSRTDGNGQTTAYETDAHGRVTRVIFPDGKFTRMFYDAMGNVITNVDAAGTVQVMTYDDANRITRRDIFPAPGVAADTTFESFQYDGLSRMLRAENNVSVTTQRYDSVSRLLWESQDGRAVSYDYDALGNLRTLAYPGGRVLSNSYDALNRRHSIADAAGVIVTYEYDGFNRAVRRDYLNNTRTGIEYNSAKRITRVHQTRDPGGSNVMFDDRRFVWDPAFNKSARINALAANTNSYAYDSVNRMRRSVATGPLVVDYALDLAGNRLAVTGGPSAGVYIRSSVTPEPDDEPVHQYTTTPFDARIYDANGNTTGINTGQPNQRLLSFDYRNRLVRVDDPGAGRVITIHYDAAGRRIRKNVTGSNPSDTRYVYSGFRVIEERNASDVITATYVYGNSLDEVLTMRRGGQDYYFHGDDLHNVLKITDSSGAVVEQYEYGDFGQPVIKSGAGTPLAQSAIGNPYLFTGREYDQETGLYNFRSRYMDPAAGRFISRDSIGAWGDQASMGNPNTYAGNNPWTLTDPMGKGTAEYAGGLAVGSMQGAGSVVGGIVSAPVVLPAAAAYGAYNVIVHPVNSWNGLCSLMTRVAYHPDGVSAGWAHVLAPEFMRKAECWEWLSDYERGKFYGQYGAEAIGMVAGGAINSAGRKANTMLMRARFKWYYANAPFHKPAYVPNFGKVRKGLEWRTDAGFDKYGMMKPGEYEFFRELARKEGRAYAVVGGTVETRIGYQRRLAAITDEEVRTKFPLFRYTGKPGKSTEQCLKSGLLEGTSDEFDVDLWIRSRPGEDSAHLTLSEAADSAIRKKFAIKEVDYYNHFSNYPDEQAVRFRCGGIEFKPDGSSTRINAPWQEKEFIDYHSVYPAMDNM